MSVRLIAAVLVTMVLSFLIVFTLSPKGAGTTPDSLAYLQSAQSIVGGNGALVPDLKFENTDFKKPLTAWPILYPYVLSLVVENPFPEETVRILNVILLVLLVWAFSACIDGRTELQGLAAVILMLQTMILTVYSYAWSETLFLPLLIGFYFCCSRFCFTGKPFYLCLLLVSVSALMHTRYVGIVFVVPAAAMIMLSSLSHAQKVRALLWLITVIVAMLCLWAWRNVYLSGQVTGALRESTPLPLTDNIKTVVQLLTYHAFGSWHSMVLLCALIPILATFFYGAARRDIKWHTAVWPCVWAIFYVSMLVMLASWKKFDVPDTRLLSPAIVLFFLGLAQITVLSVRHLPKAVSALWVLWIVLATWHGAVSYQQALHNLRMYASVGLPMNAQTGYGNFTAHPGYQWIPHIYAQIQKVTQQEHPYILVDGSQSMMVAYLTRGRVKEFSMPLNAETINAINKKGNGVLLIGTPVGTKVLTDYYGEEAAKKMSVLPEWLRYGVYVIALPLPLAKGDHE